MLIDTISNVLLNKEDNSSKPKILVCAKSRMEVDEIVFRLAFAKKNLEQGSIILIKYFLFYNQGFQLYNYNFLTGKDIKLVRIGDPETASPGVKEFTSEVLAKRHIDLGIRECLLAEEVASSQNVCIRICIILLFQYIFFYLYWKTFSYYRSSNLNASIKFFNLSFGLII